MKYTFEIPSVSDMVDNAISEYADKKCKKEFERLHYKKLLAPHALRFLTLYWEAYNELCERGIFRSTRTNRTTVKDIQNKALEQFEQGLSAGGSLCTLFLPVPDSNSESIAAEVRIWTTADGNKYKPYKDVEYGLTGHYVSYLTIEKWIELFIRDAINKFNQ